MKKIFARIASLSIAIIISTAWCAQGVSTEAQSTRSPNITELLVKDPQLIPLSTTIPAPHRARKDWNFMVYFAANNNLHQFAIKNIQQMLKIGSSNTMNLIIQLDELGAKEMTRYYLQKGTATPVFHDSNNSGCVSGTQSSLYNFILWTLQNYPANHHCLVLWNHGSGIKDPSIWGKHFLIRRNEMFSLNKKTGLNELNRRLSRLHASLSYPQPIYNDRGIAFNDTFQTYLTNQDLQIVLDRISKELLNGKKLDILCMDACMMEMVEIGSQVKNSVNYMVGSQEVEPGEGYDYSMVLAPLANGTLSPDIFAKHIVQAYASQYYPTHADYTQSAISTELITLFEENFAQITKILTDLISSPNGAALTKIIRDIRLSPSSTLEFDDPDYIDLGNFYASLNQALAKAQFATNPLKEKTQQGIAILQRMIIANVAGSGLNQATGLSFFFPTRTIHASYLKTVFDKNTKWSGFLTKYLKTRFEAVTAPKFLAKHKK